MKRAIVWVCRQLPRSLREAVLHLGFNIAREEFELFAFRYALAPHMFHGLDQLERRGLQPATVIDVGAFQGNWSRRVHEIWPEAALVMVEPNSACIPELRKTASQLNAKLVEELLGREAGVEVEFAVMESGSSVLPERSPVPREIEKRKLQTLDGVLAGSTLKTPVLLKIDAQGYELEILAGAENVVSQAEGVLLEVSLIEINEGAPLAAEVIAFMAERGFLMCEVLEIHRRPLDWAMNQIDILFVREDNALLSDKRHWAK